MQAQQLQQAWLVHCTAEMTSSRWLAASLHCKFQQPGTHLETLVIVPPVGCGVGHSIVPSILPGKWMGNGIKSCSATEDASIMASGELSTVLMGCQT